MSQSDPAPRPAVRLQADSRGVVLLATWLVGALALTAFVAGAQGLAEVATWARLEGWRSWLVPVLLDVGLAIAALASVVARGRQETARLASSFLAGLTALSVLGQVAHVLVPAERIDVTVVVGATIASAAPLTVLVATEVLLGLAIAPPVRRRARRGSTTGRTAAASAPQASPAQVKAVPAKRPALEPVRRGEPHPATAEVLRLRREGLSFARVAEATGVPTTTVKRIAAAAQDAAA